jgi:hypothetical protein
VPVACDILRADWGEVPTKYGLLLVHSLPEDRVPKSRAFGANHGKGALPSYIATKLGDNSLITTNTIGQLRQHSQQKRYVP